MDEGQHFKKFKVPAGSLVVDSALVLAIVWSVATSQTRMEEAEKRNLEVHNAITRQLVHLETELSGFNVPARLAECESRIAEQERDRQEMKVDLIRRLDRIEDKVERVLESQ